RQAELQQLERRYRSSFRTISKDEKNTVVRLAIQPSDPDFPYELDNLQIQLTIPEEYPDLHCSLTVLSSIPKGFAFNVEKGYEAYASQTKTSLLRQMNWIDKNLEMLLQQEPAATMRFISAKSPTQSTTPSHKSSVPLVAPALPQDFIEAVSGASSPSSSKPTNEVKSKAKPSSLPSATSSESGLQKSEPPATKFDVTAKPFYTTAQLQSAKEKRAKELRQLETRFPNSYRVAKATHGETVIALTVSLTDPDFAFKDSLGKELKIKYHVPDEYPLLPCTIEIENKTLSEDESRLSGPLLKVNEEESKKHVIVVDDPMLALPPGVNPSDIPEPSSGEISASNAEDESSSDEEDADEKPAKEPTRDESSESTDQPVTRRGTEIRLIEPRLENVSILRCTSLHLVVRCNRCKTTVDIENIVPKDPIAPQTSQAKNERWVSCPTCTSLIGVKFFSELVHENAFVVGLLQLGGCTAFDILPSSFLGTCAKCMEDFSNPVRLSPHEQPRPASCFACHARLTLGLNDYKFVNVGQGGERLQPDERQVAKVMLKKKSKRDRELLVVGEPLPDQGICSHYRKSRRWFRFACCNKLYPCDVCHDSREDHTAEMARRHVCGLCSREQPIKPACVCGQEFERSHQKGAFWEGGEGDPHKHKGLGKTTSKKHDRVGAAAKKKRQ
ncbi:hypothetical protein BX666DRAFT_1841325, partial [Dichotomocladium elegans]